jgi:hypothetical protein
MHSFWSINGDDRNITLDRRLFPAAAVTAAATIVVMIVTHGSN